MLLRFVFLLTLAGIFAGCATERAVVRPAVPLTTILDEAYQRTDDGSLDILNRLGEPRRVEAEAIENRHAAGQVDTLRTYVFDGLAVEVYAVTGGSELLQSVLVTGPGYETTDGLGVGRARAAVRDALGSPMHIDGDTVTYDITSDSGDPTPVALSVRYAADRVAAMQWIYYVD